jgi:hypothetical protein
MPSLFLGCFNLEILTLSVLSYRILFCACVFCCRNFSTESHRVPAHFALKRLVVHVCTLMGASWYCLTPFVTNIWCTMSHYFCANHLHPTGYSRSADFLYLRCPKQHFLSFRWLPKWPCYINQDLKTNSSKIERNPYETHIYRKRCRSLTKGCKVWVIYLPFIHFIIQPNQWITELFWSKIIITS